MLGILPEATTRVLLTSWYIDLNLIAQFFFQYPATVMALRMDSEVDGE